VILFCVATGIDRGSVGIIHDAMHMNVIDKECLHDCEATSAQPSRRSLTVAWIARRAAKPSVRSCGFTSVLRTHRPGPRQSLKSEAESSGILPALNVKTARSWRGIVPFTHLAREGRMTVTIGRRELLAALGGTAAAWPLAARAQKPGTPEVGFLYSGSSHTSAPWVAAFRQGLKEAGYVEGQNVAIKYRFGEGQYNLLPGQAADLVRRQVAVIAAYAPPAALAAKAATTTVPIVFAASDDPTKLGLVASLNRPGGNLTGVTTLNAELEPKRLELLHELVPAATTIAVLVNPINPNAESYTKELQTAARSLGLHLHVLHASNERDFDTVFATLVQLRASALLIVTDALFVTRNEQLGALTVRHAVPAIHMYREFAAAGGLISYGGSIADTSRLIGVYVGRILKGEKPANLPVQQAVKVELFINLKTAKALGITVPLPLLGRADEVIE
jgi:putative ABC transport system substrate-binding protein